MSWIERLRRTLRAQRSEPDPSLDRLRESVDSLEARAHRLEAIAAARRLGAEAELMTRRRSNGNG